jgi:hypothetical protein
MADFTDALFPVDEPPLLFGEPDARGLDDSNAAVFVDDDAAVLFGAPDAGAVPDTVPPTLTITPPGGAVMPDDAITVEAVDDKAIGFVLVYSGDHVVYDGSTFTPDYGTSSVVYTLTSAVLTIRRAAGWYAAAPFTIDVAAFDKGGNATRLAYVFSPAGTAPGPATGYPQTVLRTFRDAIRQISPWWLRGPIGGSILYAIGAVTDGLADALRGGVKTRFPGYYSNESLPLIGRERRIRRGRVETEETYATRLIPWLDHHRVRGGPYALLAQVHAFYAPDNFPITLIYENGRMFVLDPASGSVERLWVDFGAVDPQWAKWTLFYKWPTPIEADGIWSDPGTWDDGGVWDTDMSAELIRDIRVVPREWNNAHAIGYIDLDSGDVGGIQITISVET